MSTNYDPNYADDNDDPFYLERYNNFPHEIVRKAKKLFRPRDDIAAAKGKGSPLVKEINASER